MGHGMRCLQSGAKGGNLHVPFQPEMQEQTASEPQEESAPECPVDDRHDDHEHAGPSTRQTTALESTPAQEPSKQPEMQEQTASEPQEESAPECPVDDRHDDHDHAGPSTRQTTALESTPAQEPSMVPIKTITCC
ncbi:uncharacterized protein LOC135155495 [Lytechinus pictus]|uniref:uncharacterized protein LOC135155495 n=1 Tax=Lytechinus pictus TaxID=7653 RepID=UPI0030B9EDD6